MNDGVESACLRCGASPNHDACPVRPSGVDWQTLYYGALAQTGSLANERDEWKACANAAVKILDWKRSSEEEAGVAAGVHRNIERTLARSSEEPAIYTWTRVQDEARAAWRRGAAAGVMVFGAGAGIALLIARYM